MNSYSSFEYEVLIGLESDDFDFDEDIIAFLKQKLRSAFFVQNMPTPNTGKVALINAPFFSKLIITDPSDFLPAAEALKQYQPVKEVVKGYGAW